MKKILTLLLITLIIASCGGKKDDYLIVIKTDMGEMKAVLFDETPLHKANFIKLVEEGKYDSTIFHRVIEGFMIQGGDVNAKKGENDKVAYTIPAEIQEEVTGKFLHTKGAFAAARMGDNVNPEKASSGCQFYIVDGTVQEEFMIGVDWDKLSKGMKMLLQDVKYEYLMDSINQIVANGGRNNDVNKFVYKNRHLVIEKLGVDLTPTFTEEQIEKYTTEGGAFQLDGEYTVFGRVVEGLDVIDKIAAVDKNRERPVKNVGMVIELIPINKSEISSKYGISFPEKSNTQPE